MEKFTEQELGALELLGIGKEEAEQVLHENKKAVEEFNKVEHCEECGEEMHLKTGFVAIPSDMLKQVDKLVAAHIDGYYSREEFVKSAIRDKIMRL